MIEDLKKIRDKTGQPLNICKEAYEKFQGDVTKAVASLVLKNKVYPQHQGYRFDTWVNLLGEAIVTGVLSQLHEGEVLVSVDIELDGISYWPMFVSVVHRDGEFQFEPYGSWDATVFDIPDDADQDDPVLDSFISQSISNPSFSPSEFTFGDYFKLPGAVWRYSLMQLEEEVAQKLCIELGLEKSGFDCVVKIGGEIISRDKAMLLGILQREVKAQLQDRQLLNAFAELCYEDPTNRAWLVSLF
ncbi:MAG: hypothetical protein OEZ58_05495 [Gammaproteobacteria bacterium]|nr:hypothetical protein [Gammaproteobacteria bacterium]MDH5728420.1 hypothetical protein [Gammaproteobacteria bacterium]